MDFKVKYLGYFIFSFLFLFSGCENLLSKGAPENMRRAAAAQFGGSISFNFRKGFVSFKGKDSELIYTFFGKGELPADLPQDVYFDKTINVKACVRTPRASNIEIEEDKEQSTISNDYQEKMKENGWTLENEGNMSALGELQFSKEGRLVEVSFTPLLDNRTQTFVVIHSTQTKDNISSAS